MLSSAFCFMTFGIQKTQTEACSEYLVPAVPGTPPGGMSLTGMKPYWNEKRPPAADKRKNAPDLY
jgi:hypothetical protein